MRVGYNPVFGIGLGVIAAVCVVLGLLSGRGLTLLIGAVNLFAAAMYAFGPQFVATENAIEVKNPLGITLRRIAYASPRDLRVDGNKLFVVRAGVPEPVKNVGGWLAHPAHWRAFAEWVQAGGAG